MTDVVNSEMPNGEKDVSSPASLRSKGDILRHTNLVLRVDLNVQAG